MTPLPGANALRPVWQIAAPLVLAALFVTLALVQAIPSQSDENIYHLAGWTIATGELPYRDFFFAHPPLQAMVLAAIAALGGYSLLAFRGLCALAAIASLGLALRLSSRPAGAGPATLAVVLCLLDYGFLHHNGYGHGLGLATALLMAGAVGTLGGRPILGGLALAAALLTRLAVAPGLLCVLGVAALTDRRRAGIASATAMGVVAFAFILLAAAWGERFWDPVFFYHLAKPGPANPGPSLIGMLIRESYALTLLAGLGLLAPWLRSATRSAARSAAPSAPPSTDQTPEPSWRQLWRDGLANADPTWWLAVSALAAEALLFYAMATVFPYYLTLTYPFLALLAAHGLAAIAAWLRHARSSPVLWRWSLLGVAGLILLLTLVRPDFPGAAAQPRQHLWHGHRLGPIGDLARAIFFVEVEEPDRAYHPITRWIWNSQRHAFPEATAIATWIRDHTTTDQTLLADSMQAPLLAAQSGRRLANQEVDLNPQRFRAGFPPMAAFLERALANGLTYVVVYPHPERGDLFSFPEVRALLREQFRPEQRFGPFVVHRRVGVNQ